MLHLFFQPMADDLFYRIKKGDDIVFFDKAIFSLIKKNGLSGQLQKKAQLHVLERDLKTRGFDQRDLVLGVDMIDHVGLVALTEKNKQIFTWN